MPTYLYQAETSVLMVEVKPTSSIHVLKSNQTISQVILRRLMSAEQVIEHLGKAVAKCQLQNLDSVVL